MFVRSSTPLSLFPTYLLPAIPFRRRKTRTDGTTSAGAVSSTEANPTETYLTGHASHLRCARCATDICLTSQIISKGFTGRHGRAYLVSPSPIAMGMSQTSRATKNLNLPNTKTDSPSQRQLVTGAHTVSDVRCAFCASMLGWKYDAAEEESQRYKVGKYILETKMICTSSDWEHDDLNLLSTELHEKRSEGTIEFDSQDEDECEDLFAGIWSPSLAMKRRRNKAFGREKITGVDMGQ